MMGMKMMDRYGRTIAMSAAALAMTAALTIESSMAYFTTYTESGGSQIVSLGTKTEIEETVSEKTKHVVVKNADDGNECFVRVKVFSGSYVTCTPAGTNWTYNSADGYWYYDEVVAPGGRTEALNVSIAIDKAKEDEIKDFNVVVVQECTPVIYENGRPTADWSTIYTDYNKGEEAEI